MKEFFDTSVLVAAFWNKHPEHEASIRRFAAARKQHSACALHTLAEVYSAMTALPVKDVISPAQVLLFIQDIRYRLTVIAFTEAEYVATIERTAEHGGTSGRIYDALLLQCADKIKAETIYTWNIRHFRSMAPELSHRISTP